MIAVEAVLIAAGAVTALTLGGWAMHRRTVTQWSAVAQADVERGPR